MKKSCATCRLSIAGMPGKCNSRRCLANGFSGWRPPLDTTPAVEPKIVLTDPVPIPEKEPDAPKDLCDHCSHTYSPVDLICKGCDKGSNFVPIPIKKKSEKAPESEIRGAEVAHVIVDEVFEDDPDNIVMNPIANNRPSEAVTITAQEGPEFEFKADTGKTDMTLLEYFPNALEALCKQSGLGCKKYMRGSWKDVPNARRRYTSAMLRHFFQEGDGPEPNIDDESGMGHDIAVMWNAMVRVELRLRGYALD